MKFDLKSRGFALAVTLLFLSLLVVMVAALFSSVRDKLFLSQTQHDQTASLYLAEAAIHDAMAELENDPNWTAGFTDKQLPSVNGTYSLSFQTGVLPHTNTDSVNNFDRLHPDTHHGPGTLASGHTLLIATARVGRAERTVEALVDIGGGLPPLDVPILADGVISLKGTSTIEGIKSLSNNAPLNVGIHSNLVSSANDLIDLTDSTSGTSISGLISSSGSSPGAINLGPYVHSGGQATSEPAKPFPPIDILGQISAKSSAPGLPASVGGVTVLNANTSADYYHIGPLVIPGDLKLQGANLYVNGSLTVSGSIEGNGSVYVADKTTFQGSSKVLTASPDKVALYSHGSVELSGFDGTQFLNLMAASNPAIGANWPIFQTRFPQFLAGLADPAAHWGPYGDMDDLRKTISWGRTRGGPGPGEATAIQIAVALGAIGSGGSPHLPGMALPPTTTQGRMAERFVHLSELFYGEGDGGINESAALNLATSGIFGYASVDALLDHNLRGRRLELLASLGAFDINRPGEAFFQGLVYTHGYLHARAEVTVVGAVVTQIDPAASIPSETISRDPSDPTATVDTVNPGDVYLLDGSRILFVEDFFQPYSAGPAQQEKGAKIVLWMGR